MPESKRSNDAVQRSSDLKAELNQEIIIHANGTLEIPWFAPQASDLVRALWHEFNSSLFPIHVISGQLYCG
jgi:hypothetical protein